MGFTLDELKIIASESSQRGALCRGMQNIKKSTNYQDLISSGIDCFTPIIGLGILDSDFVSEIPNEELLIAGIYNQDTAIVNPTGKIYVMPNVNLEITINGFDTIDVISFGNLTINMSESSFMQISLHKNSTAIINQNDDSISMIDSLDDTQLTLSLNDISVSELKTTNSTKTEINIEDSGVLKLKSYEDSVVNITNNSDGTITYKNRDSSIINFLDRVT